MARRSRLTFSALILLWMVLVVSGYASGADWPQWRHDAARTAASPEELAGELHLQWVRRLAPPQPAWPKYPRLCFDVSYEPVVLGTTMFVPSMVTDSVTAIETETGAERWRFYTDGPVRLAPVARQGKVYSVSDDGHLYCVEAGTGRLLWKFRGLPSGQEDRKVLGNDRLISLWPARGGPVLDDGKIYFAAGVWPFEGVAVYALDAETGRLIWKNEKIGNLDDALQDHSMRADGGISPQGYLALIGGKLVVPSGRALPGVLDPETGKLEPYMTGWGGRDNLAKGCWHVSGTEKYLFQSGDFYELATQSRLQIDPANAKELGRFREPVLTEGTIYFSQPVNEMRGYRPAGVRYDRILAWDVTKHSEPKVWEDEQGRKWQTATFPELWSVPSPLKVHAKAGRRLYAGTADVVAAIDVPEPGGLPKVSWEARLDGTPSRMLAADGRLFVVTREGSICCFGPKKIEPKLHEMADQTPTTGDDKWTKVAADVLKASGAAEGYCLVLGAGTGRLAAELAGQSKLHVIAVDPDADRVARLRRLFDGAGLYGRRIVVDQGDPFSYPFPPYLASLIVSEDPAASELAASKAGLRRVFSWLRPHGGVACLPVPASGQEGFAGAIDAAGLSGAEVVRRADFVLLRRGALPGAAPWTHENADAGDSLVSADGRVKPPLGLLWFGGAVDMLFPEWDFTHSRPPTPLVAGGRMFFQVFPKLHAVDIYTGRHLWTRAIPGTDLNAQRRNVNYAAAEDSVYVVAGKTCVRLDPATGSTLSEIPCPADGASGWREIRVWGDCLIGTTESSLVSMDRRSGETQWKHAVRGNHVRLAVGDGCVFLADARLPDRRGEVTESKARLVALDVRDGKPRWQTDLKLKGKAEQPLRLAYSEDNDVLVAVYNTVRAYDGKDGKLLWGPQAMEGADQLMLHQRQLITQAGEAYDPQTGSRLPERLWSGKRRGCTRVIGGQHLLSIRNGHASYMDVASHEQTFFRGIRAGCTNSLVAAGGILNAPDFSHGCSCNYAVFSSMALVHLPEVEQ